MRKRKREKFIVVINEIGDLGQKIVEAIHELPFLAKFIWHTNKSRFLVSLGMTPLGGVLTQAHTGRGLGGGAWSLTHGMRRG